MEEKRRNTNNFFVLFSYNFISSSLRIRSDPLRPPACGSGEYACICLLWFEFCCVPSAPVLPFHPRWHHKAVSRNPYANFDAEENRKAYDLSQKQRAMERKIRRQKTKLLGLRQAVDSAQDDTVKTELQNEYDIEAVKLGRYNAQYNRFCEANDLKRLSDRISVAKWTRSEAGRAVQSARAHYRK